MTAPQGEDERPPGPARFVAVTALALAAVLGAAVGAPWSWESPDWLSRVARDPVAPPPQPLPPEDLGDARDELLSLTDTGGLSFDTYLLWLLGAALLVVLVVLARRYLPGLLVRRRRRDLLVTAPGASALHAGEDPAVPELREAVERAHDDLRAPDADPQDAVVAAWVALERAAERAGARRDPAQTPTEFTAAVLAGTRADAGAITTLRGLYHRARFGERPLGQPDLDAARAALARIAADLTPRATAPTTVPAGADDGSPTAPHDGVTHPAERR